MKSFSVLALMMAGAVPVWGQVQPPPAATASEQKVDSAKAAHLRHLLDLLGMSKPDPQMVQTMWDQMRSMRGKGASEDERSRKYFALLEERMLAKLKAVDFSQLYVAAYDKHFTDEEITALIAFYESALGRKWKLAMQQVAVEAMPGLMSLVQKLSAEAEEEIYKEHPELKPKPIPDPPPLH